MDKKEALNCLKMFLHKDCSIERTKFLYNDNEIWQAVKIAYEALKAEKRVRNRND